MNTAEVMPIRRNPPERRKRVALGVKAGKSNRAIARELGCDEKLVRLDRDFLARPVKDRPVKQPKKVERIRDPSPEERMQELLKVGQGWIAEQTGVLADVVYILDKAGKLLHRNRLWVDEIPSGLDTPSELIARAQPKEPVEEDVTGLEYSAEWFYRWLALCTPREETLQDEVLRAISAWAREPWRFKA